MDNLLDLGGELCLWTKGLALSLCLKNALSISFVDRGAGQAPVLWTRHWPAQPHPLAMNGMISNLFLICGPRGRATLLFNWSCLWGVALGSLGFVVAKFRFFCTFRDQGLRPQGFLRVLKHLYPEAKYAWMIVSAHVKQVEAVSGALVPGGLAVVFSPASL